MSVMKLIFGQYNTRKLTKDLLNQSQVVKVVINLDIITMLVFALPNIETSKYGGYDNPHLIPNSMRK